MKHPSPRNSVLAVVVVVTVTGCAAPVSHEPAEVRPAEWPAAPVREAGESIWQVEREQSELLVRVDPAGPMARLGHRHVVGGAVLSGRIATGDGGQSARADLEIDVTALEVDRPEWRAQFGLDPDLGDEAVSGTRANLLGKRVLDAANFPTIAIRTVAIAGPDWMPRVTARVRLRDQVREITVPTAVFRTADRIEAVGRFEFDHADFGLEPFTAAGGALRVADPIRVRFRIVARTAGG